VAGEEHTVRNLKVVGKALVDVYDNMFVLLFLNIIWIILAAVPLSGMISTMQSMLDTPETASSASVFLFVLAVLFVLLTGPASYALAVLMRKVTEFESISIREFVSEMRANYRRAWLLGLVSVIGTFLLFVNLSFYSTFGGWAVALVPLFLLITVLWLLMQLYLYPLAVITEGGPARVLRNAAIVIFRHPGLSLLTGIVALLLIIISSLLVIPWVIVTIGVLTALGTRAVRAAVRRDFGRPDEDPLSDEPLPPIAGDDEGRSSLPHYGWRAGRREAGDEEPRQT
jgi:uncharacterized membrane protein YesL